MGSKEVVHRREKQVLQGRFSSTSINIMMLRTMVTLLISFICLTVGVTQGQVIVSPVFRRASQCIGSLQIYKDDTVDKSFLTLYESKFRTRTLRNKIMVVEGNCCWEVYKQRRHKSTVTFMSSTDGPVSVNHPVRSVLKLEDCFNL